MNINIFGDKMCKLWMMLPHSLIYRCRVKRDIKKRFHYDELSDISIVATNCIGGEIYYLLGLPFTSPFINTSMRRSEFIELVSHFREYMECDLQVFKLEGKKNLVGILESNNLKKVTIRFPHDKEIDTIKSNWEKRKARINYEKLVFICDDKGLSDEDYSKFDSVSAYRKICFITDSGPRQYDWAFVLQPYRNMEKTQTYNGKDIRGLWKFVKMWDFVSFINKGQ